MKVEKYSNKETSNVKYEYVEKIIKAMFEKPMIVTEVEGAHFFFFSSVLCVDGSMIFCPWYFWNIIFINLFAAFIPSLLLVLMTFTV